MSNSRAYLSRRAKVKVKSLRFYSPLCGRGSRRGVRATRVPAWPGRPAATHQAAGPSPGSDRATNASVTSIAGGLTGDAAGRACAVGAWSPGRLARARQGRRVRPPAVRRRRLGRLSGCRRLPKRARRLSPRPPRSWPGPSCCCASDLAAGHAVGRRGPRAHAPGPDRHRVSRSAGRAGAGRRPGARGVTALLDGADAAHHARAEHGRAVVDGDGGRLQGRAAGRQPPAAHVSHAHHRGRHHQARPRVRRRRRRGRVAGDLHRAAPWRAAWRRTTCGRPPRSRCRASARSSSSCRSRPATPRTRAATPRRRTSRSTAASAR